ncbi:MAG: hypothetical protein HC917_28490 [Richelia sp. SM2_1_7]|nr:hypothetical protein [Richelia sp. SM2_1_7]
MERLETIIAQRRKELGLPPESKEENSKDHLPGWEQVNLQEEKNQISQLQQSETENVTESLETEVPEKWEAVTEPKTETPWQKR